MSGTYDDWMSDTDTSSIGEEERVRKLFQACDYNRDGYIDRCDLEMVMEELGLTQSVSELLIELGADETGRVSYQDFLSRRRALCCEIDLVKRADRGIGSTGTGSSHDIHNATTSHSGSSNLNKQELWEWDSGARDLSPEPLTGQLSATPPPDAAMADLASTVKHIKVAGSIVSQNEMGPAVLGPSLYYYGDIEKNRTLRDDVPLTHKARKKRDDLDAKTKIQAAGKREGIILSSQEFNLQDEELNKCFMDNEKTKHDARIVSSITLDQRKEKKRKKQHQKYGRRRTNTYDGEIQKCKTPPEILRYGNSDGETDGFDDDVLDAFIHDFKFGNGKVKNGEDLPLLGLSSTNASCPVALADRSKAYLCKNLDLEADDVSLTYDIPNARRSITYSNAGTFPMPDVKRGGHYDQPETGNFALTENDWHNGTALDNGVTRSRSWYLCCPGSGLVGENAESNTANHDGSLVNLERASNQTAAIISAPSPGENQYLHLAAVSSLKNEVLELSARLLAAHRDRDNARDALCASQSECARLREALSAQARCSEERLTELHGVIAELRRACVARERAAIPETHEDDSEIDTSYRDNSVTGNSDRTTSACDADETASLHNELEIPASPAALPVPEFPANTHQQCANSNPPQDQIGCASNTNTTSTNNNCVVGVHEGTERLNLAPADSTSFDEEDALQEDRRLRNRRRPSPRSPRRALNSDVTQHNITQDEDEDHYNIHRSNRHSPCVRSGVTVGSNASPQTKMASRVRLRRTHEDGRLTGKEICQEGVFSSAVAEHLTRSALSGGITCGADDELQGEERLMARIDRLEADNMLLGVTLRESKEYADRLSLTCAQCSAEAGALRLALAAADRAVEAYDVLLALAETSHSIQDCGNNVGKLRLATERVARQLLARLDWEAANGGAGGGGMCVGPWADHAAMLQYQGANDGKAWSTEEEERLRGHVSRLKRERTVAASGAQSAQWPLQDEGSEDNLSGIPRDSERSKCMEAGDARKMDMETAVLMQEVMSLREERAELKARLRSLRPSGSRQTHTSSSGGDEGESERRLLEALARENTLKARLQRLMASVHQAGRVTDNSEEAKKYSCPRCGTPLTNNRREESETRSPHPEATPSPVIVSDTEVVLSSEANNIIKQQIQSAISCSDNNVEA